MRRLPILIAFGLVFVLFVVAAATAAPPDLEVFCKDRPEHPKCSTTTTTTLPPTTPSEPPCVFDDGVLVGWPETNSYRCVWTVTDPSEIVSFELRSPDESVTTIKLPHLIVNDDIVFPSDICFHDTRRGPQDLPFPGDDLWTFSPADRGCGDGPYFLTISVQKIRSGVELVMK